MNHGIEAAILTVLIVPPLIYFARRFGLVDRPGGRKHHVGEVPLVGGLAIYAALAGVAALHWSNLGGDAERFTILAGAVVAAGLIDDWRGLRPFSKLALHFVIAGVAVFWGGNSIGDLGDIFGFGHLALGWASPLVSIVGYVVLMNAVNLIDGADGVAGAVTCIILVGLVVLVALAGAPPLGVPAAALGAILGFLLYNMPLPGRRRPIVFLGEAGSMLIGFTLGWALFEVRRSVPHLPPIALACMLALPVLDMAAVSVSRIAKGKSPFTPGRDHLHHLLLDHGISALGTALATAALALLFTAAAAASALLGVADYLVFIGLVAASGGYGIWSSRLRRSVSLPETDAQPSLASLPTYWHATDHAHGAPAKGRRLRGARAA
jgi:UDP-GlcNAc:undecaprenyl-phosphate GlcNAc-1-phosphate transferase